MGIKEGLNLFWSKVKVFFIASWKNVLKYSIIIGIALAGIFIVVRIVFSKFFNQDTADVERIKGDVEKAKEKVKEIEKEKEEIMKEHEAVVERKKEREERAKKYFPEDK